MKRLCLALALLFLAGCVSTARVESGTVMIGDALMVSSDGAWNRVDGDSEDASQVWTAEGVTLDMVLFYDGNFPGWRPRMLPHDIVDLYEALVVQDRASFRLERLAPAQLGDAQGFLFEHRTTTRDGLVLRGRAYGAVVDGRLYFMSYTAPASHFYAKHLPRVEALAASARIRRRESGAFASP
jgi:hypothetical protein